MTAEAAGDPSGSSDYQDQDDQHFEELMQRLSSPLSKLEKHARSVSRFAKNCSRIVCKELCTAFHDQVRPQHLHRFAAGLCAEN